MSERLEGEEKWYRAFGYGVYRDESFEQSL